MSNISLIRKQYDKDEVELYILNADKTQHFDKLQLSLFSSFYNGNLEEALNKALMTAAFYRYALSEKKEIIIDTILEFTDVSFLKYIPTSPISVKYKGIELLIEPYMLITVIAITPEITECFYFERTNPDLPHNLFAKIALTALYYYSEM